MPRPSVVEWMGGANRMLVFLDRKVANQRRGEAWLQGVKCSSLTAQSESHQKHTADWMSTSGLVVGGIMSELHTHTHTHTQHTTQHTHTHTHTRERETGLSNTVIEISNANTLGRPRWGPCLSPPWHKGCHYRSLGPIGSMCLCS